MRNTLTPMCLFYGVFRLEREKGNRVKKVLIGLGAALALGGCADYYGPGPGYINGAPVYDAYYDGGYGGFYDGYWGAGGVYYYRTGPRGRYYADRGGHFRHDAGNGGNWGQVHGHGTDGGHFHGPDLGAGRLQGNGDRNGHHHRH